ncbi:MAG: hypothetical protein U9N56_11380 [Actinomycetota bacterium]|nr:hypothetical protein [Actinomycetota bacterium]
MRILPRPFSQVLGDALNSITRTWRPIVSTASLVFVPVGLLSLLIFRWTGATEFLEIVINDPGVLQTLSDEVLFELIDSFLVATAIAAGLQTLATVFVYLAAHKIISGELAGSMITGHQARRFALGRYPLALASSLIALVLVIGLGALGVLVWSIPFAGRGGGGFVVFLFLIACVAPALWMAVGLSMLTPVVALERRGLVAGLVRSFELVKPRWGSTLGYLAVVGLLGTVSAQLIQLIALPLASLDNLSLGISVASIIGLFAQGLIVGGIGSMWTVWYVDLRARIEPLVTADLG